MTELWVKDNANTDIWDDTELIKAYDKAKMEVMNRLAKKKLRKDSSSNDESMDSGNEFWEEGMPCRAIYSEDGVEYEAVIEEIDEDFCTIRYIGYENEEQKLINELKPSHGKQAVKKQIEEAGFEEYNPILKDKKSTKKTTARNNSRKETNQSSSIPFNNGSMLPNSNLYNGNMPNFKEMPTPSINDFSGSIPMPPPMPPKIDGDPLLNMMMSWYMNGFYTGYYRGLNERSSQE